MQNLARLQRFALFEYCFLCLFYFLMASGTFSITPYTILYLPVNMNYSLITIWHTTLLDIKGCRKMIR